MKSRIATNLLGRSVMLSEDGKMRSLWHTSGKGYAVLKGEIVQKGDFAHLPGGENAIGEIVAVYLRDGEPVAAILWQEDGSIQHDIPINYFRVIT